MLTSVKDLLSKTIEIYKENFGLLVGYAAWLFLPLVLLLFVDVTIGEEQIGKSLLTAIHALRVILAFWIAVVITLVVAKLIKKQKIETKKLAQGAWNLVWPVFWISVVVGVIQVAGFILVIIPFFIFTVWYAFATYEIILDGKRGFTALSTSRDLSRGRWWPVFWRLIGGSVILLVAYVLAIAVFSGLTEFLVTGGFDLAGPRSDATLIVSAVLEILFTPIPLIFGTLLYLNLKEVKAPK